MSAIPKHLFFLILSVFTLSLLASCWPKGGHNEYLEGRMRVSEREMKKDKKILAKGSKAYKKQMRRNRKHLFGRAVAPKE